MNLRNTGKYIISILVSLAFLGCDNESNTTNTDPIRGVKTIVIGGQDSNLIRRYPSVLKPSESSSLSFQISGRLKKIELSVGQKIMAGEIIAELDDTALKFALQEAKAAQDEAAAAESNALKEYDRNQRLKQQGLIGQAVLDASETNLKTLSAKKIQITNKYSIAKDNLAKSKIVAPFNGVINNILVSSYGSVSAGTPIVEIYNPDLFEVRFSVSNLVAAKLVVGSEAVVTLADFSDVRLSGRVSELAESSDTVSSFPVVVAISDRNPKLKAGMAAEVSIEFRVSEAGGYLIPLSAVLVDGMKIGNHTSDIKNGLAAEVFIFEESNSTVKRHPVIIAGVRDNQIIVTSGLKPNDRIAVAGLSFLRDGQVVKLLDK
jgi:RND family efflux transporter MFP subunit